jgi:hypothetical protein
MVRLRPHRLIAIFGSGETSPTMTSVHQDLIGRVDPPLDAVLLDTPFGFQENADEIAGRIIAYYRERVGCDISLNSLRHAGSASPLELEQFLARLSQANYVFAGPGSPTYALRHWRGLGVREELVAKLTQGGCLAFASAAAIGLGAFAIPVYEIYKVGDDPSWTEGLDVLGEIGLRCAVVPHYNNHEGGTHDTRFCYMGESRLRTLESMLPAEVMILGVDEYTACIIDIDAQTATVRGRGALTARQGGVERRWTRTTLSLGDLQNVSTGGAAATTGPGEMADLPGRTPESRDVEDIVAAVLEIESELPEWIADVADADGRDRIRTEVRHVVLRLEDPARRRGRDEVRQTMAPLVDTLLSLRGEARRELRFRDADRLRTILTQWGVQVQDTPLGTAWSLLGATR